MKTDKLLTPAILTSYRPLSDKSFNISLNIPEQSEMARNIIHKMHQQAVFVMIKTGEISKDETEQFETLDPDLYEKKSKSERLRNTLYRNWEQNNEGHIKFGDFYDSIMEIIITHRKSKLK